MSIRSWFRDEWNDIKGHLKYDIYRALFGGAVISSFFAFWKALQHARFEPYLFGSLLLLSATLFFYTSARPSVAPEPPTAVLAADPLAESSDPKKPNLKAEILDVFFLMKRHSIMNNIFVLLNVRVVNHGEEEAVVTDWNLKLEVEGTGTNAPPPSDQGIEWWSRFSRSARGWRCARRLDATKNKLLDLEEPRVYQASYPGGQNGNSCGGT